MDIIKNKKELATSELRKKALDIIECGIKEAEPYNLLKRELEYNKEMNAVHIHGRSYYLFRGRIFVIGGGKAAGKMAEAIERILGAKNISDGIVLDKSNKFKTNKIKVYSAGHPLPDRKGAKGTEKILGLKEKHNINEKDLVICLVSGGNSSMMASPVEGLSLKDKQKTTQLLLESGADIREINTIRKHLSKVKGGRLGEYFSPAQVISLVISDVVGNDPGVIGSGPTVPDPSTFNDAALVLNKYDLKGRIPERIYYHIERGCRGEISETPKDKKIADNFVVGRNAIALEAMALKARELGLKPLIASNEMAGDPEKTARENIERIAGGKYEGKNAILFGGETTPRLPAGYGRGGRNMHLALSSMKYLEPVNKKWIVASFDTDGCDYTDKAAGAIIDNETVTLAGAKGISPEKYLTSYDSYNFFKKIGGSLIKTGDTGTNVGDVTLYIVG